ncbi:MAG: ribosomal protein L7/L12 [Planctomycetaceae bacterium]|nr:ribosomal protein L7/L12 [Planctomycetaceae bacterium]
MSADLSPEAKNEIADAIFNRQKIHAIKLYREATGQGLKEAKDFIETLTEELQEKSPEKFTVGTEKAGCGSAVFFLISGGGVLSWWFV